MSGDDKARLKALRDSYKHGQRDAAWTALTLDRPALDTLLSYLDERVGAEGCDHSHRLTQQWADQQRRAWEPLAEALRESGGYCDCEVLANVDPEG